jgi:hypothetical protein
MPPTLRLWGGLGHRGLSGDVRLPSAFGSDPAACEHCESHFFPLIYFAYFVQKWEMRPLRTAKSANLVRRMSFFDREGQVPADVSRTAFLSGGSA